MLEAKYGTAWYIFLPYDEIQKLNKYEKIVNQAFWQNNLSGGRRVEWHFVDPELSWFWRVEFKRLGYRNITVVYTPYNEFYNYNIGKILSI